MGVNTKKIGCLFVATVLSLLVFYSIHLLMTMSEIEGFLRLRWFQTFGVWKLVPAPIAHGAEGHALFVSLGVRLQSGDIHGGYKVAVAHR